MVTAQADQDVQLPWDAFLQREADLARLPTSEQRERWLRDIRMHIDRFRVVDWPNIKRQLLQDFNLDVREGLEPHWVSSGRAVFWQEQIVRVREQGTDESGRVFTTLVEKNLGWRPLDGGIAANTASGIASLLKRGLRFRPPSAGVDVLALEAAVPSEVLQSAPATTEEPPILYNCHRHGYRRRGFRSWKAYMRHCITFQETPEENPPSEVLERMRRYSFYCFLHDRGFHEAKNAKRHITVERRRPGRTLHPTILEMEVKI